jgi:uncharacterized protein (DUF1697 family)
VRTAAELEALDRAEPFATATLAGKPQVMLLFEPPTAAVEAAVVDLASDDDLLAFGDRALHWLPSGGVTDSSLELDKIARLVGLNTMRTTNTIRRLVARP